MRRLLPLIVAAALLSGCGESGAVEKRVDALYDALAAKDARSVCGMLTTEQRRILARGGRDCEDVMGQGLRFLDGALPRLRDAKVTDVEIDGDRATATVERPDGRENRIGLRKEGGRWLVSALNLNLL